jgi:hypothetical protein
METIKQKKQLSEADLKKLAQAERVERRFFERLEAGPRRFRRRERAAN